MLGQVVLKEFPTGEWPFTRLKDVDRANKINQWLWLMLLHCVVFDAFARISCSSKMLSGFVTRLEWGFTNNTRVADCELM